MAVVFGPLDGRGWDMLYCVLWKVGRVREAVVPDGCGASGWEFVMVRLSAGVRGESVCEIVSTSFEGFQRWLVGW